MGTLIDSDYDQIHRLLVDSVGDYAVFAMNRDGVIITWNAGAERLHGYSSADVIGKHASILYPKEAVADEKPARDLAIVEKKGRLEEEGWRERKDGTRIHLNMITTVLRDDDGGVIGYTRVSRDLSYRGRTDSSLRESEERFRLLVQSVKDYGIFMLDPDGVVVSWNEGASRIKGYSAQEIIGRHFSTFYPEEDKAKPAWELQIARKEGRYEEEGWRVRKDGTRFWANIVITSLYNPAGDVVGFAKVTRDLTERRAAEERALADARRVAEAESANRAKSEFLAAMSHELRTPLNAIAGYVDLLSMGIRGPVNEQQVDDLNRIRRSQQHLLAIINDLLNFSRIEAGRITYDKVPVVVSEVIESIRPMIEPQADARSLRLEWPSISDSPVVCADRQKFEQIMINLLTNAVKFTPVNGSVRTACTEADGNAVITVTDSGPGIPVEKLEAIFEPFVQVGRSLSSSQEGVGLGLAISRDLARAMGGEITVQSDFGKGAEFVLKLPLLEQS